MGQTEDSKRNVERSSGSEDVNKRQGKKSKKKYFVRIDLFVKQKRGGNIFKKYNEQHEKYMYDPEWIIETARKKNFEVYDVASNPKFGESRIFFVFKRKLA